MGGNERANRGMSIPLSRANTYSDYGAPRNFVSSSKQLLGRNLTSSGDLDNNKSSS